MRPCSSAASPSSSASRRSTPPPPSSPSRASSSMSAASSPPPRPAPPSSPWSTCPVSSTSARILRASACSSSRQGERPDVRSAKVYVLSGELSRRRGARRHQALRHQPRRGPRGDSLDRATPSPMDVAEPADVEVLDGFTALDDAGLAAFIARRGLAMDLADTQVLPGVFRQRGAATPPSPRSASSTPTGPTTAATPPSAPCSTTSQIDDARVQGRLSSDYLADAPRARPRRTSPSRLMDMGTIGAQVAQEDRACSRTWTSPRRSTPAP